MDAEDGVALLIEDVIGRVEVLRRVLVIRHRTAGITDDTSIAILNRNHDAPAEEVEIFVRLLRVADKTHLFQKR